MKLFHGFSADTGKKILLDVGSFFVNYEEDKTYEENVAAGHRTGATQGGGSFSAKMNVRRIKIDGVPENTIGTAVEEGWTVTMNQKMLEQDAEHTKLALAAAKSESVTLGRAAYTKVTAKSDIEDTDYQKNVAYAGRLRGSNFPLLIVVYNAINLDGLSWNFQDQNETVTDVTFTGNYDLDDLDNGKQPFAIYIPDDVTNVAAAAALAEATEGGNA